LHIDINNIFLLSHWQKKRPLEMKDRICLSHL